MREIYIVAFALMMTAVPAMAQDRLPPVPADKMTEAQTQAAAQFKANRGQDVFGPFVPLLRSPEVMLRTMALGDYLRYKTSLGSRVLPSRAPSRWSAWPVRAC